MKVSFYGKIMTRAAIWTSQIAWW